MVRLGAFLEPYGRSQRAERVRRRTLGARRSQKAGRL